MRVGEQLSGAYFATFQPFVDYYGDSDYADKIISGALDGTSVTLNSKSFNFDDLDFDARGGKLRFFFRVPLYYYLLVVECRIFRLFLTS
jgi:hypothetical protein